MKKNLTLFMVLLAAVMMTGCSSDELGEFNANGDFVVKGNNPPSKTDFLRIVDGYGWREDETHEVTSDGKWKSEDYWEERIGGGPTSYAFSGNTATRFVWLDAVPASAYYDRPLRYDEASGKVYFGDNEAFTVISASDDEITIVKPGGIRGGDDSKIYLYIKLRRMTAEELKAHQEKYWVNGDDIDRTITEEDIFHKWVVTQCPGLIINREGDRSNDRHYIRFMPDGTVEGKYDNTHFKGTYTCELVHTDTPSFRGEENSLKIQITPDADGGQWPGCFKDFDQGLTGYIIYGSHLTITIPPDDFTWQFVRGYDE